MSLLFVLAANNLQLLRLWETNIHVKSVEFLPLKEQQIQEIKEFYLPLHSP